MISSPERLLAASQPRRRDRPPQPRAREDGRAGLRSRDEEFAEYSPQDDPRREPRSQPPGGGLRGPLLHLLAAPAGRRPLRRRRGVRRRPADQVHARPRPAARGRGDRLQPRSPGSSRPPRWSCSTTRPAACWRWSAARTSRRPRSTSPPTASASPARRSSPSPWSPRSRRALARARSSPRQPQQIPFAARSEEGRQEEDVTDLFEVNNYEDNYLGSASLATATTYSDNSVYAQLGTQVGVDNVADDREKMGIETDLSTDVGVLDRGRPVRALQPGADPRRPRDRRHAARDGARLQHARRGRPAGSRARSRPRDDGPVAIRGRRGRDDGSADGELVDTTDGDERRERGRAPSR